MWNQFDSYNFSYTNVFLLFNVLKVSWKETINKYYLLFSLKNYLIYLILYSIQYCPKWCIGTKRSLYWPKVITYKSLHWTFFQFNLVCNREWYVTLTQSTFMLGQMLGVFSSGLIADRYFLNQKKNIIYESYWNSKLSNLTQFEMKQT